MTCSSCHWSKSDGEKLICRLGYAVIRCREFVYEPGTDEVEAQP